LQSSSDGGVVNTNKGRVDGTAAAHTAVPERHLWGIPVAVIPGLATDRSKLSKRLLVTLLFDTPRVSVPP
jgi:hypothetical protein